MNKNFIVEKSRDGFDILKIESDNRSIYIGSKYNEFREIKKIVDKVENYKENNNYLIWGLGAGTYIRELINYKYKESAVLILETELEWIKLFEKNKILSDIDLEENKIFIAKNKDDIKRFLDNHINEHNVSMIESINYSNYDKYYSNEISEYYELIKVYIDSLYINRNTRMYFSKRWFESRMKNCIHLPTSFRLNEYKDYHKGKPAVIVSAGPSLSKNIHKLKEFENAVIISSGRTLKALHNINVNPDYTVIVDGGEISYELVNGYIDKTSSKLVYHLGSPYEALEKHKGEKIVFSNDEEVEEYLDKKCDTLQSGGSVAHTMVSFAAFIGCNPIIFIGQDFAYTNEKTHADIANTPGENTDIEECKNNDGVWVSDIYGKVVRTSNELLYYKMRMEDIIKIYDNIKFINSTEGGAYIDGAIVKDLDEVLKKYNEENIKKEIKNSKRYDIKISKNIRVKLKRKEENMNKSIVLYNNAIKLLEQYKKVIKTDLTQSKKIEIKLSKIEKEIYELNKELSVINDLAYPIINKINNDMRYIITSKDNEKTKQDKVLEKNIFLYKEINESIKEAVKLIHDTIIKLTSEESKYNG